MAEAVMQMKSAYPDQSNRVDHRISYFLDRLYMSRISIHMLINQHTIIFGGELAAPQYAGAAPAAAPQHVGCIDPNCDVALIVKDAFNNAAFLCDQVYLQAPALKLKVVNASEKSENVQFVSVPA